MPDPMWVAEMTKRRRLQVTRMRALYHVAAALEVQFDDGVIGSTTASTYASGLQAVEFDDAIRTIIDELRRKANRIDV
jgi:hypothetical protein